MLEFWDQAEMVGWWDDDAAVTVADLDSGDVRAWTEDHNCTAVATEQTETRYSQIACIRRKPASLDHRGYRPCLVAAT